MKFKVVTKSEILGKKKSEKYFCAWFDCFEDGKKIFDVCIDFYANNSYKGWWAVLDINRTKNHPKMQVIIDYISNNKEVFEEMVKC